MSPPVMENLARDLLESAPGLEVVTDYVELPAETRKPVHTHPGEEFAYVLDGTIHVWEQDRGEAEINAGGNGEVSKNVFHTVRTARGRKAHRVPGPRGRPTRADPRRCLIGNFDD